MSKKNPPESIKDFPTECEECDGWGWIPHNDFSYSEPCKCNPNFIGKEAQSKQSVEAER